MRDMVDLKQLSHLVKAERRALRGANGPVGTYTGRRRRRRRRGGIVGEHLVEDVGHGPPGVTGRHYGFRRCDWSGQKSRGAPSVVHSSATGRRRRGRNATEQQEE